MKKTAAVFLYVFILHCSFGQDINTLLRLQEVSAALGITHNISVDTLMLKAGIGINYRTIAQQMDLLKAAEYYRINDYVNSSFYMKKVINLKVPEYSALKFLLIIGNYAYLKDIKNTARYFYIADRSRLVDMVNFKIISLAIRNNFKRDDFDDALSRYYYYHQRLKLMDEIIYN